MDALALLDLEEGFALSEADLVPATELPWRQVAQALDDERYFIREVAHGASMSVRDVRRLQRYWCAREGLVQGDDLRRLTWTVDAFRRELEYDLLKHVGVRLGALWRAREWRLLLNLIDHLPRASHTHQAMMNHPVYAERVAEAAAQRRLEQHPDEMPSPPLVEHTPEVAMLAGVIDAVNALRTTLIQTNLERGKSAPKIPPYPRPRTLVDTMVDKKERMLRWAAHESLADRVLRGRRDK